MNDNQILLIGVVAFGLMLVGIILTIVEFRSIPKKQPPEFEDVAFQAQPDRVDKNKSAAQP